MKVLIAFEESGRVREAFRALGHDAISCDLLPSALPGPHVQGDARELLRERWDLVIAHPPCTYLCNSGVRWLHERPERWFDMWTAAKLFVDCLWANAPCVAVENPVMHGYAQRAIEQRMSFSIQPWQFGHGEVKRTCFWTRGLPPLLPTEISGERVARVHRMPPGPDRQKERSRTYLGIAAAMAKQWGGYAST